MSNLSGHIAAPVAVELMGKTYLLSPLNFADFKEYEIYLQGQILERAKGSLNGLSLELQKHTLDRAEERADSLRIGTKAFDEAAMSPGNLPYLLWLMLRKKQPEVTLEAANELTTMETVPTIVAKIEEMRGKADPLVGKKK